MKKWNYGWICKTGREWKIERELSMWPHSDLSTRHFRVRHATAWQLHPFQCRTESFKTKNDGRKKESSLRLMSMWGAAAEANVSAVAPAQRSVELIELLNRWTAVTPTAIVKRQSVLLSTTVAAQVRYCCCWIILSVYYLSDCSIVYVFVYHNMVNKDE